MLDCIVRKGQGVLLVAIAFLFAAILVGLLFVLLFNLIPGFPASGYELLIPIIIIGIVAVIVIVILLLLR